MIYGESLSRGGRVLLYLVLPASLLTLIVGFVWRQYRPGALHSSEFSQRRRVPNNDVTEEVQIPPELIGFIIGRQGNRVKELEAKTNSRIRFRETDTGKVAVVSGAKENVQNARDSIDTLIREKLEKKLKSVELTIPSSAIGRLIGRQGQNILSLQKESGASVTVERGRSMQRTCTIVGTPDQVVRAVAMVNAYIEESKAAQSRDRLSRRLKNDSRDMKNTLQQTVARQQDPLIASQPQGPLVQLLSCELPAADGYFTAVVSCVASGDGCVWIQPLEQVDAVSSLDDLCDTMTTVYSKMATADQQLIQPMVDDYCAAPFSGDGRWYRARVVAISNSAATTQVLFIDYGDLEWLPSSQLKLLQPQFCTLPLQACRCQLGGVAVPAGGWDGEALQLVEEITHSGQWDPVMVKIMCHTSTPPLVAIVNTSGEQDLDVASLLVAKGWADPLAGKQLVNDNAEVMESDPVESSLLPSNLIDLNEVHHPLGNHGNYEEQSVSMAFISSSSDEDCDNINSAAILVVNSNETSE